MAPETGEGAIGHLVQELSRLPGIGPKSAERIAHFLLAGDRRLVLQLADALRVVAEQVRPCRECFNLTDGDRCPVCSDPRRDPTTICVVETPRDLSIFERAGNYRGRYHVLGGRLAPLDNVGPDQLKFDALRNAFWRAGSRRSSWQPVRPWKATGRRCSRRTCWRERGSRLHGWRAVCLQVRRSRSPTLRCWRTPWTVGGPFEFAAIADGRFGVEIMKMGMDLSPRQILGQKQILAPRMIQSMEILQLPIAALQERIEKELTRKPGPGAERRKSGDGIRSRRSGGRGSESNTARRQIQPGAPLKRQCR